jgi:hypothetical protein
LPPEKAFTFRLHCFTANYGLDGLGRVVLFREFFEQNFTSNHLIISSNFINMKNLKITALLLFVTTLAATAQDRFTSCSAAFLDKKIIVDEYSPTGKCRLPANATGELTVCFAELSAENSIPKGEISFMAAIRDGNTKTLMMYSDKVYRRMAVEKILAKCRKGDSIVLLIMEDGFAVPHNEILVE